MLLGQQNFLFCRRRKGGRIPPTPSRPEGLIGQYKPYLNSNDSPTRDILKDYSGQGHDIQLYNFGYALQSGYGSWAQDFKNAKWYAAKDRATIDVYSTKFIVSSIKSKSACFYYQSIGGEQSFTVPSIKFRVTGLTDGQTLLFNITGTDTGTVQLKFDTDGIHTIDSFEFKGLGNYYGFQFSKLQETCDITVEQIPDYPGALVSDGVDDYGICENFPILTKEKGYTVVAVRKWLTADLTMESLLNKCFLSDRTSSSEPLSGAFNVELNLINGCYCQSFGERNKVNISNEDFIYQNSTSYCSQPIQTSSVENGNGILNVFSLLNSFYASPIALYSLEIYDHDLTDEEIESVKEAMISEYEKETGNVLEGV